MSGVENRTYDVIGTYSSRKGKVYCSRNRVMSVAEKKPTPGLVYISRIPPGMKPEKVKHLMSQFGVVGRVFLQPEDPFTRKRRQKQGGSRKKVFTEGWVEFAEKKVAKHVAISINNTRIGSGKHSRYYDDLWNIKYLPKFRWTHLTEKLAYESAVHEQRMRSEISQAKRESRHYVESVEKSRMLDAIRERKRKQRREEEVGVSSDGRGIFSHPEQGYKQRKVSKEDAEESRQRFPRSLLRKILPGDDAHPT
ncbi:uncharacterized protein [Oscarella lobularis]|uniref:uncharacterized protein n=1 Tax=Oscarella lobularis TaxID=121494 RepID=UPI003313BF37